MEVSVVEKGFTSKTSESHPKLVVSAGMSKDHTIHFSSLTANNAAFLFKFVQFSFLDIEKCVPDAF